jgi:2-amino-4-hydroxy-6-hydroxymethyldihydropteridine diphosphokinase
MAEVYLSLGSNEGDRLNSLVKATKLIDNLIGTITQYSSVVESEPWGFSAEMTFYNMVLLIDTECTPHQVLTKALEIETSLGRIRHGKEYTNRSIDIDILFYNAEKINTDNLVIPHPLMHKRKFVLQPLAEIAPELIHPVLNSSITELLLSLNEPVPLSISVEKREFASLMKL